MKSIIVLGTRPEIIKLAPIIQKLPKSNPIVFSGQHYDYNMGLQFFQQLGIRKPDHFLRISHSPPSQQISEIVLKLSKIISNEKPDTVLVQGDTNTVLAAGICSLKQSIPVSHIESGLRSFDWRMSEEHNRVVVDHLSEFLFAPTNISKLNLIAEKVHGQIHVTGNTVIDSINRYSKISRKKSTLSLDDENFALLTLHRAENVDSRKVLTSIIKSILDSKYHFIFPIHPRTFKQLKKFNLLSKIKNSKNIKIFNVVGYFEMLELMKKSDFIVTDSGGIQEESTASSIKKKTIVVRKTTDRPEAISSGYSELVGTSYTKILHSINKTAKNPKISIKKSPYGDGNASKKIIDYLRKNL